MPIPSKNMPGLSQGSARAEKLLPFTPDAVAAIVEYGKQSMEDKARLSLRFGPIVALLKEADYWAQKDRSHARYRRLCVPGPE